MPVPRIPSRSDRDWSQSNHRIRLLPSTVAGSPLGVMVRGHWGPRFDPRVNGFLCPSTWPELHISCPICRVDDTAWCGTYTNAVYRNAEEAGVQIIDLPPSCTDWLTEVIRGRLRSGHPHPDITDPIVGSDILIKKGRRYNSGHCRVALAPPSPLHEDPHVSIRWMNERQDIQSFFPVPTAAAWTVFKAVTRRQLRIWNRF
jgi:hypothetical protein